MRWGEMARLLYESSPPELDGERTFFCAILDLGLALGRARGGVFPTCGLILASVSVLVGFCFSMSFSSKDWVFFAFSCSSRSPSSCLSRFGTGGPRLDPFLSGAEAFFFDGPAVPRAVLLLICGAAEASRTWVGASLSSSFDGLGGVSRADIVAGGTG